MQVIPNTRTSQLLQQHLEWHFLSDHHAAGRQRPWLDGPLPAGHLLDGPRREGSAVPGPREAGPRPASWRKGGLQWDSARQRQHPPRGLSGPRLQAWSNQWPAPTIHQLGRHPEERDHSEVLCELQHAGVGPADQHGEGRGAPPGRSPRQQLQREQWR